TAGQGTQFTLKVPLTLIISPALFVRCGSTNFALPLAVVEEIRRLRADEIGSSDVDHFSRTFCALRLDQFRVASGGCRRDSSPARRRNRRRGRKTADQGA